VKITEALEILRAAQPLTDIFEVQLACSFTPLQLKNLLAAHLQKALPQRRAVVTEGIFGDLIGTIEQAGSQAAVAVVIEWGDIDPRLKYREGGAWGKALQSDVLQTAKIMLGRIERAITQLPAHATVAVSLPTLPLLPVFHPPTWQSGHAEILLQRELIDFAARISSRPNVSLVSERWLNDASPSAERFDLKSDLLIGFPYTLTHADKLAVALAKHLAPRQPLKGVITDLDNTFWSGLVGEAGPDSVKWDSASRYYLHGIYQKLLAALADEGILVGIASKNDPAVVAKALERRDLLIPPEKIFPIEVHWAPKSESVTRILKKWNILADSVSFVDDTPLELAEVAATHPGITCIQFPAGDYNGVLAVIKQLRDLCGKTTLSEEDTLRLASIRQGTQFQEQAAEAGTSDEFLSTVAAKIYYDFDASSSHPRTLELVNKTNQFNLNGNRLTHAEWQKKLERPGVFVTTLQYEDKFGGLGIIAVLQGLRQGDTLKIETWVMSCRAFSRRIEHQTLKTLFEKFGAASVQCDFATTPKNGPLQEFFATILGHTPQTPFEFSREQFERVCPALYHQVEETTGVTVNG
jgi:FkbH-like protein